jgi:hypothetical protein
MMPMDAGAAPNAEAGVVSMDGALSLPVDAGSRDAASDSGLGFDAAGLVTPTPAEVAAIISRWCLNGHQQQGSDGFVFDGALRSTLLANVEAPATPAGDPPGAAACRREKRIRPGDGNSYLLRKMELGRGRTPNPRVCGQAMPMGTVLSDAERVLIQRDLERLRRWVIEGAALK